MYYKKRSDKSIARRRTRSAAIGFTLVELLVVIGIIALLIGILLPALNRARGVAKQVACLSQLRQIGQGMLLFAQDHGGFVQVAGYVHGIDGTPAGLSDVSMRRYAYYKDTVVRPMPLAGALAQYVGQRMRTDSRANLQADQNNDSSTVRKIFTCPGEITSHYGISIKSNLTGSWTGPTMYSSYAFNEAVLSYSRNSNFDCLRGRISAVSQPSRTVLLCDNYVRNTTDGSYFTLFANSAPSTLADAYFNVNGAGPDMVSFDRLRHRQAMNYLAADMHGEAAMLPAVGAIYSATGALSDINIVAP